MARGIADREETDYEYEWMCVKARSLFCFSFCFVKEFISLFIYLVETEKVRERA